MPPARLAAAVALLAALACSGRGNGDGEARVECADLESGHAATYRGDDALVACLHDPAMQSEGHRRVARLGPGRLDFGAGARLELGAGWTIEGAGSDRTTLFASRPTTAVLRDDIHSALLVRGAGVRLAGFTFDGACTRGPSPAPECRPDPPFTLVAIVVACAYGLEAPPDCDVDGLGIEDVRVLATKTPFLATASPPHPERGEKGLFANFRDFTWTIRRFRVAERASGERPARIFELGNGATPDVSQGPGVGVAEPRRYVVELEDVDLDTHVGRAGGQLAGVLTMAVNAPVSLDVRLRGSRWTATERLVGIATNAIAIPGADAGSVRFRCEDSELVADHADWTERIREPGRVPCPPFDAAVAAGEFSRPGGPHRIRVELVRCPVRVLGGLALCPAPTALDLGPPDLAPHVSACVEASPLDPPARGAGRIEPGPCEAAATSAAGAEAARAYSTSALGSGAGSDAAPGASSPARQRTSQ